MNTKFTKTDTNICKGIAILFLVLHHSVGKYYNHFDIGWYAQNSTSMLNELILFLSTSGKVCVSLFSLLSGYGISHKYKNKSKETNNPAFVIGCLVKFYKTYIPIWMIIFMFNIINLKSVSLIYGNKSLIEVAFSIIVDVFGISQIFGTKAVYSNWYVLCIIEFYVIFPIMYHLTKKYKLKFMLLCALPTIVSMLTGGIKDDNIIFYLFDFAVGIYALQNNVFDTLKKRDKIIDVFISSLLVFLAFILRLVFSLPVDIIFALSLVYLETAVISKTKYISRTLCFFGKNSANIWLISSTVIVLLDFIYNGYTKYLLTLLLSLIISVVVDKLKAIIQSDCLIKS